LPSRIGSSSPQIRISERCVATRSAQKPSVIQFRGQGSRTPEALALAILSNLPQLADALQNGSIVTFEPSRVRVCAPPINVAPEHEQVIRRQNPAFACR
jgi:hypothetical protein